MKKHILTTLFLTFVLMAGQAVAQDQAAIEKKIKKMNEKFSKQMIKGEFTFDHYADDAISMPQGQPMLEGLDAIKANMEQFEASGMKFESFTATPTKVMMNGKQVTEIGTYNLTITMPNVPEPIKDKGKYLTLWEIQDNGDIKVKVETWNTDLMEMSEQ